MLAYLQYFSDQPLLLGLALVALSWLWEDAAVIAGALLAAEQQLSVFAALVAVFVGICSGDMGLYFVGRLGRRSRRLRGWILASPKSRKMRRRFQRRTLSNILLIRFIPGLRTLGFTLCGLWAVPIMRFLFAMLSAALVWITIVFTGVYRLGSSEWLLESNWKWALMLIALTLLIVNNVVAQWFTTSRARTRKPVDL